MSTVLIVLVHCTIASAGEAVKREIYALSNRSTMDRYVLQNGTVESVRNIVDPKVWHNAGWPSLNRATSDVYFEADTGRQIDIFKINLNRGEMPQKITTGRAPSLSPDGGHLVFYRHPGQLWLLHLEGKESRLIDTDAVKNEPVVWVSNRKFLYRSNEDRLLTFDVASMEKNWTGHMGVIPSALSPDGRTVLCGGSDARKVYLYTFDTNRLALIRKTRSLFIGSTFVWSLDGKSFLYERQTWANQIRLNESTDLFLCTLDGDEKIVVKRMALFGGFALQENEVTP